tara:strand:+ start:143 stop:316 length:174 start_codon:yes stop_codon:yes gene_type:complete
MKEIDELLFDRFSISAGRAERSFYEFDIPVVKSAILINSFVNFTILIEIISGIDEMS